MAIHRFKLPIVMFAALITPALAQAVYPYYGGPVYRTLPAYAAPNAAALGPWPWNFNFGGGPAPVLGSARDNLESGYNFNVGGGYNFTPRTGFVLEFMESGLGVTDKALQENNQATDGDASIWSFTLNPVWRFRISGPVGAYLIGGGGFYEREERFREPETVFALHGGRFFAPGFVDVHQIDDTGGVNVGAGLTWNVGWGTKFYVEARYHYIFTTGAPTQMIPITFGFRW